MSSGVAVNRARRRSDPLGRLVDVCAAVTGAALVATLLAGYIWHQVRPS